jgi:hypothetical protein
MNEENIKDQIFNFDQKTMKIPFEILANSKEYLPSSGKPQASRPEASWITLQKVCQLLDLHNIVNTIDAIFVAADDSFAPLTTEEKQIYGSNVPVKMWIFNRLIARISMIIPEAESMEGTKASIAFGYNKNGIQIAFGTGVDICSNFCILHGKVFQTYGDNKTGYPELIEVLGAYIDKLPQWQLKEYAMIQTMINTEVGEESDIDELFGILLRSAVLANSTGNLSALNITEVSELVREVIKTKPEDFRNVWDLYNVGTSLINFSGKVNLIDAIDKHSMWRDVIFEKYDVSLPTD